MRKWEMKGKPIKDGTSPMGETDIARKGRGCMREEVGESWEGITDPL